MNKYALKDLKSTPQSLLSLIGWVVSNLQGITLGSVGAWRGFVFSRPAASAAACAVDAAFQNDF